MALRTSTLLRMEMVPVLRRLPAYTRLAYGLLREPALHWSHKALLVGGVAYLLSPIDIIPGFLPVVGQLDDLAVTLWALRATLRAAPADVAERHLRERGLEWAMLDEDLRRIGRSGRLVARGAYGLGRRAASETGRVLWRLGTEVAAAVLTRMAEVREKSRPSSGNRPQG
jgi:uncharacterized membrane protein YkvA (DUF1232 family)